MIAIFESSKFSLKSHSDSPRHGAGMGRRALSLGLTMVVNASQLKEMTDKLLFVSCGSWTSEKLAVDALDVREAIFVFNHAYWRSIAAEAPPQR